MCMDRDESRAHSREDPTLTTPEAWADLLLRARETEDADERAQFEQYARSLAQQGNARESGDLFFALGETASETQQDQYARAAEQYRICLEQDLRRYTGETLRIGDLRRMVGEAALWAGQISPEDDTERQLLTARQIYQLHLPESAERMALCCGALALLYYAQAKALRSLEMDLAIQYTLEGIELLERWVPEQRDWLIRLYRTASFLYECQDEYDKAAQYASRVRTEERSHEVVPLP